MRLDATWETPGSACTRQLHRLLHRPSSKSRDHRQGSTKALFPLSPADKAQTSAGLSGKPGRHGSLTPAGTRQARISCEALELGNHTQRHVDSQRFPLKGLQGTSRERDRAATERGPSTPHARQVHGLHCRKRSSFSWMRAKASLPM